MKKSMEKPIEKPQRVTVAHYSGSGVVWKRGWVIGQRHYEDNGEAIVVVKLDDGSIVEKLPRDVRVVET